MKHDLPIPVADSAGAYELERLLSAVGEAVVFADDQWIVWYCNDIYLRQTGLDRAQVIGKTPWEYQPLFKRSIFYEPIETCRRERRPMAALGYSTLLSRCLLMRVYPVSGGMVLLANDATDGVIKQFRLAQKALEEPLTGLPNKLALEQDLETDLQAGRKLTVAMLGLTGVHHIVDAQGLSSSDAAMIEVASRLLQLTETDEKLYRFDDVFALVTPHCGVPALDRVYRLLAESRRPIALKGQMFVLASAAGVAAAPEHGVEADLLLHRSSMALHQAQRRDDRGKAIVYEPGMDNAMRLRSELEAELRCAVREGQFILHLQPKACLSGKHVIGAEALIRWPHPTRNLVSPGIFLPIAEECGLMRDLDRWVLRNALQLGKEMAALGLSVPIAINLSVQSLADPGLVDDVKAALEEMDVPARLLEVEIPEGSVMRDVETSTRVLADLEALGVSLSIDDFGTGYSSFAYLSRFPVQTLKVDRSFVIDMAKSEASRKIVAGLIQLAHSLSLRVVAEGAETAEQMSMLRRMDCDEVQGFGYARPMPFDAFCDFVRGHRTPTGPSAFTI